MGFGQATAQQQRQHLAAAFLQQKLADALQAGQQLLGLSQSQAAAAALERLREQSEEVAAAALEGAAQEAGGHADRRRALQRQRDLVRARLGNLRNRQHLMLQHQAAGQRPPAACRADGQPALQQQAAPAWDVEAAAALCEVGMTADEAAAALQAAHAYAVLRAQQQEQQETEGGAGAGGKDAAALSSTPGSAPSPPLVLGARQVEAACRELTATAGVPVAQLRRVVAGAPQLLACTPTELQKQHGVLASVWRKPRRLTAAILEHPAMLAPEFPAAVSELL